MATPSGAAERTANGASGEPPAATRREGEVLIPSAGRSGVPEDRDLRRPDHAIPPQSDAIREELRAGDRELLHCLDCGRQLAALRHDDSCLFCGSGAVVIEAWR